MPATHALCRPCWWQSHRCLLDRYRAIRSTLPTRAWPPTPIPTTSGCCRWYASQIPAWKHSRSPYQVFGLPTTASIDEIKARYRELCLRWHPDVAAAQCSAGTSPASTSINNATTATDYETVRIKERFIEITDAYAILSNPALRIKYQRAVKQPGHHMPFAATDRHPSQAFHSAMYQPGDEFIYNSPAWQMMNIRAERRAKMAAQAGAGGVPDPESSPHQRAFHITLGLCLLIGIGHFTQSLLYAANIQDQRHFNAWMSYTTARQNAQEAGTPEQCIENFLARKRQGDIKRTKLSDNGY
ncbi:hypothetical protein H4R34_002759 [Dimargaris verticillata]|uniref:J domain-containing protein n=1 Tax=Dimargaris verticillata TaxID=2761393 RepID=A0A9W8EDT3_9FUNG|nr:hypothetical protein H4R34_002759 [Dimargaris verticillata]